MLQLRTRNVRFAPSQEENMEQLFRSAVVVAAAFGISALTFAATLA
jgi:hypothetical protein